MEKRCEHGYIESEYICRGFGDHLPRQAYELGFLSGAADMRERAANTAPRWANLIRALPLEAEKEKS